MAETEIPTEAQQVIVLREQIARHQNLYYNDPDNVEISDADFDVLVDKLEALESQHPELVDTESPTQTVGGTADVNSFAPVRHKAPMLSLKKATTGAEMYPFLRSFGPDAEWVVQPKIDGVSLSLEYESGTLVRAATRGDGTTGDDVTVNASNIKGVITKLPPLLAHVNMIVRGEVVITAEDFASINTDNTFANPRNAAAGALRSKTPKDATDRKLSFVVFDVISDLGQGNIFDALENLEAVGFTVAPCAVIDAGYAWDAQSINLLEMRERAPYETDGLVLKINDVAARSLKEDTGHHPRWAIAFKTEGATTETTLNSITWQVGKTGIVAPVAELEPARLAGTIIRRATLHNLSIIHTKDIRVGDRVQLRRMGDTIPGVVKVVSREHEGEKTTSPISCPSCGDKIIMEKKKDSILLVCPNKLFCPAQMRGRLEHWASRDAADIDAIGEVWIENFHEEGLLEQPSDFYKLHLHKAAIMKMDRMAEGQFKRFMESIEKSKQLGLRRTLIGLSIPLCGDGTAKRLAHSYTTIESIMSAKEAELRKINDIGPAVAKSIVAFFADPDMRYEITALRNAGVFLDRLPEDAPTTKWKGKNTTGTGWGGKTAGVDGARVQNLRDSLAGRRVAFTGTLSVTRTEFTRLLEDAGAYVAGSVSGTTDYLIVGDKPGSKLAKATSLGIKVISETEARGMV